MQNIENLSIDTRKYTLQTFLNKLNLHVSYDDLSVEEMSSFVQAIFLDIQHPCLVFADISNNLFLEKGPQIYSLFKFFKGDFKLSNVSILSFLNGFSYDDLPARFWNNFNDKEIKVNIFYKNTSEEFKLALLNNL